MKVSGSLTNGLSEKQKKDFEYQRKHSVLAEVLKKELNRRLDEIKKQKAGRSQYDKASWPFFQAHQNGAEAEIEFILTRILNNE